MTRRNARIETSTPKQREMRHRKPIKTSSGVHSKLKVVVPGFQIPPKVLQCIFEKDLLTK